VQKNDRNRHERTKTQGNTQKAWHPEEADLQLQPQSRVPGWEHMLADVDRQYVTEYGIAERQGRVFRVLKD
jgi:hypothetical protein